MGKKLPARVSKALNETKSRLDKIYEHQQHELILFGSYARGDFSSGSDIDLLLLLDEIKDIETERDRYSQIICELSLKYDTVISVISMDQSTYQAKRTPLILNVQKEGVQI